MARRQRIEFDLDWFKADSDKVPDKDVNLAD
jgi:hypothetical protein